MLRGKRADVSEPVSGSKNVLLDSSQPIFSLSSSQRTDTQFSLCLVTVLNVVAVVVDGAARSRAPGAFMVVAYAATAKRLSMR